MCKKEGIKMNRQGKKSRNVIKRKVNFKHKKGR